MLFNVLTTSALFAAIAIAEPRPYKLAKKETNLAKMSFNQALGLMVRQDQGYQPTSYQCGPGTTCPESCGADTVQCASTDDQLHCYEPSAGQSCCSDGSGNACDEGYYCTDNSQGTWCCPNGTSLSDCAALYSLTGSLTSEGTVAPTSTAAPSSPASVTVSVSSTSSTTAAPVSTTKSSYTSSAPKPTYTQVSNGTLTTSSTTIQFTGAANQLVFGAMPALAVAAGAVLAL